MSGSSDGWIPAYRKLFDPDHEIGGGEPVCPRFAWLDICQMAAWSQRTCFGVALAPGQVILGARRLASRWGWNLGQTQRFIRRLVKLGSLEAHRTTKEGTVYTISQFDSYRGQLDTRTGKHIKGSQPMADTPGDVRSHSHVRSHPSDVDNRLADTLKRMQQKASSTMADTPNLTRPESDTPSDTLKAKRQNDNRTMADTRRRYPSKKGDIRLPLSSSASTTSSLPPRLHVDPPDGRRGNGKESWTKGTAALKAAIAQHLHLGPLDVTIDGQHVGMGLELTRASRLAISLDADLSEITGMIKMVRQVGQFADDQPLSMGILEADSQRLFADQCLNEWRKRG